MNEMAPKAAVEDLREALRLALPLLRGQAEGLIEAHAEIGLDPADAEGGLVPLPGTIDPIAWPEITRALRAIRAAERVAGRPEDGCPRWLDQIIDKQRSL